MARKIFETTQIVPFLVWHSVVWLSANGFVPFTTFIPKPWQLNGTTQTPIPVCEYHQITIPSNEVGDDVVPRQEINVHDLTSVIQKLLEGSSMIAGAITVISRHTTTSIVINEYESRLARDIAETYRRLIPPDERSAHHGLVGIRYQHNDIHQRPESADEAQRCFENGWDISDPKRLQAWRDQEPINAHSHLLAMLLGSSESIPVVDGSMVIGQWQSILLIDLDGPRDRTVGIQLTGFR